MELLILAVMFLTGAFLLVVYFLLGKSAKSGPKGEELYRLLRDPQEGEFLTLYDLYQRLGVGDEAIAILRQGVQRKPTNIEAQLALARIELIAGHTEQAQEILQNVIRCDPENSTARELLNKLVQQQNKNQNQQT